MGMGQNLVPLVNIKIAGKWMFIPLKMVLIGIDPYPHENTRWRPIVSSAPRLLRSPMQMFPCRLRAQQTAPGHVEAMHCPLSFLGSVDNHQAK